MSKALGMRCVWGLCGVLAGVFGFAPMARAEVTSDTSGSIMVYPKVVYSEEGRDTVIQLSNTSNNVVYAWCFYVDARESFGRPLWRVTDFRIVLTKQQPTHWVVSQGRQVNNGDNFSDPVEDGAGLDPGAIPPVQDGFQGELKCIQSDPLTRLPFACTGEDCRNDFTGHAAITDGDTTDVATYKAVGLEAVSSNADETLIIGGSTAEAEYEPCADVLVMDFIYDGAIDPISGTFEASSELTLVPCTQDFRGQTTPPVVAQFLVYNEFEQRLSTSRRVECLLDTPISRIDTSQPARSIFSVDLGGTITGQARIRGVGGGLAGVALLSLATDFADPSTRLGWASYSLNTVAETEEDSPDTIYLP